jgi:ribosomal protein S18 acetylase RimI-like enzyme
MKSAPSGVLVRPLSELDLSRITAIDERLTGSYKPEVWERRVVYYLRRDAEACPVAEIDGKVVGFIFTDLRGGEFGLEETSGWIERFGVDPDFQGRSIGRSLFETAQAHLRSRGATILRTLVGPGDDDLAGFLRAVGFQTASLQALELQVP